VFEHVGNIFLLRALITSGGQESLGHICHIGGVGGGDTGGDGIGRGGVFGMAGRGRGVSY